MATNPKNITIHGRISFPTWTYQAALARDLTSKFPKPNKADVTPEFNLLVEQDQLDKLKKHILEEFLPYVEAQHAAGEKRDVLEPAIVAKIRKWIEADDLTDAPPNMPIKAIHEKTQPLAPECVASVVCKGSKGTDIAIKAAVYDEDQLAVPDPDLLTYPVIKPIGQTVLDAYPGAYAAATLNLYSYFSNKTNYGMGAGANTVVVKGNVTADRFGGGTDLDEDAIFLDD